jgi:hypothetical protein
MIPIIRKWKITLEYALIRQKWPCFSVKEMIKLASFQKG